MSLVPSLLAQVDARLAELRPLVEELERLRRARADLIAAQDPARRAHGPRPAASPRAAPVSSAEGDEEATRQRARLLIEEHPGLTADELNRALGAGSATAYRVLPSLLRSGQVRRRGGGYYVA